MASLGVKLPLTYSSVDGFTTLKDFVTLTKQNFKMLLLTSPGERIMDPNYGVGIKTFLFSLYGEDTEGKINTRILEQTGTYMPYITIQSINFANANPDLNTLSITINYLIPALGLSDLLDITI